MKIGLIYPIFTGPYGGERHIINLVNELKSHKVTLFTHRFDDSCKPLLKRKDVEIIETGLPVSNNHNIRTILSFMFMPSLAKKIKGFDIIVGSGWQTAYCLQKIKSGKKVYYCLEPPRFLYDLYDMTVKEASLFGKLVLKATSPYLRKKDKDAVASTNHLLANGQWSKDEIKKVYGRESTVIYPGVEVARFKKMKREPARKQLKIPTNKKVYLSVCKLHRRKRIDLAIDYFNKINAKNSVFYIVGGGPDQDALKKKASKNKNIKMLGRVSEKKVELLMAAADYFIFTAKNEPFGIAPMEAKAAGCELVPYGRNTPIKTWKEVAGDFESELKRINE